MVKKKVVDYIKTQLQKGYSISSIRDVMLRYGYTNKDVDDAVNEVYHPTIRHEIHLSGATILAVIVIFTTLAGSVLFFYYNPQKTTELLDLNLEPVKTTVEPGESIVFLKEISNLGSSKRYDIVIKQEIIDQKTFEVVTEKTETRAIETFGSTQTQILVPKETKPGSYILRAIVGYDNKKAVATLPVKVTSAKSKSEEKTKPEVSAAENEIVCDDNNLCTDDAVENGVCISRQITPCCGNNICEGQESCDADCQKDEPSGLTSAGTIDEIKELAKVNPSKAMQQCNKIDVPDLKDSCIGNIGEVQRNKNYCVQIYNARTKDLCYSNIAKAVNDKSICSEISTDGIKDSCYMTFVLDNKDYSVCDKITNKALRQSCESLKQLNELNRQSQNQG